MDIKDQVQIAAEHAQSIIAEIKTHSDTSERVALLGPYFFAFQRELAKDELALVRQRRRPRGVPFAPRIIAGGRA